MIERKTFDFIYLLKFLGIIMITNSHFKPIYSGSFKQMAFGGAFGCALFFFCSGFTMIASKDESFWRYLKRRVLRILPTFWIFLLLSCEWQSSKNWFCWGHYWFLQAILVFYCLFYFVKKYFKREMGKIIIGLFVTMVFLYFIMPHDKWMIDYTLHENRFTWLYYFAIMLLGAKGRILIPLKDRWTFYKVCRGVLKSNILKYLLIPICFFIIYALKFVCTKFPIVNNLQLLFPLLLVSSCYIIYIMLWDINLNKFGKFVKFVANITLEIYIVQFVCIAICSSFPIYIRLVSTLIFIFISAYILHWISGKVSLLIGYGK